MPFLTFFVARFFTLSLMLLFSVFTSVGLFGKECRCSLLLGKIVLGDCYLWQFVVFIPICDFSSSWFVILSSSFFLLFQVGVSCLWGFSFDRYNCRSVILSFIWCLFISFFNLSRWVNLVQIYVVLDIVLLGRVDTYNLLLPFLSLEVYIDINTIFYAVMIVWFIRCSAFDICVS